jgi:hypothetical protein
VKNSMRQTIDDVISVAIDMGWTAAGHKPGEKITRSPHDKPPTLYAPPPNNRVSVVFPTGSQLRESALLAACRKIVRYADPTKRAIVLARALQTSDPMFSEHAAQVLQRVSFDLAPIAPPGDEPKPKPPAKSIAQPITQPATQPAASKFRTVISERPWLAHRGTGVDGKTPGRRYASAVVIERTWSDGAVDYACAASNCDYTQPLPQSVARHYAGRARSQTPDGHAVTGSAAQAQTVRDPEYVEPLSRRRQKSVQSLTQRLLKALERIADRDELTDVELADRLAEMLVPVDGQMDIHAPAQPLTDAEILMRIRNLLDRGEYLALRHMHDEALERVTKLESSLEQNQAALQAANDRWQALQALIVGEG